jgi:hypothetical protein
MDLHLHPITLVVNVPTHVKAADINLTGAVVKIPDGPNVPLGVIMAARDGDALAELGGLRAELEAETERRRQEAADANWEDRD